MEKNLNQAASFGGTNIDPSAWEDKKNPGESRFPAQVYVLPVIMNLYIYIYMNVIFHIV